MRKRHLFALATIVALMTSFSSVAGSSGSRVILPPRTPAANFDPPSGPGLPALTLINEARFAEEGLGPLGPHSFEVRRTECSRAIVRPRKPGTDQSRGATRLRADF